jgi:hypothetical protein
MRALLTGAAPHFLQPLPVGTEEPMLQRRQLGVLTSSVLLQDGALKGITAP